MRLRLLSVALYYSSLDNVDSSVRLLEQVAIASRVYYDDMFTYSHM